MGSSVTPAVHAIKGPGNLAGADGAGTTIGVHGTLAGVEAGGGTIGGTIGGPGGEAGGAAAGAVAFAKWPAMAWL